MVRFSTLEEVQGHLEEVHEVVSHDCENCGKNFETLMTLEKHMRTECRGKKEDRKC